MATVPPFNLRAKGRPPDHFLCWGADGPARVRWEVRPALRTDYAALFAEFAPEFRLVADPA